MCYVISMSKKGISTLELSQKFGLTQKTCWFFKRKMQQAMHSSNEYLLDGLVEVDEFVVGGPEPGKPGRSKGKKKLVVLAIEIRINKHQEPTLERTYARLTQAASAEEFQPLFDEYISLGATINTDEWSCYLPLAKTFELEQLPSNRGKNFPLLHAHIMNLKSRIRGIHHHVSRKHIQAYLHEFHFRFNRRAFLNSIFFKLINRVVDHKWLSYKVATGDLSI